MTERIYALYQHTETAATAVNEIINRGITPDNISVITRDPDERYARYIEGHTDAVDGDEGVGFGAVIGTLTGLGVALVPGFGPVFATGPLAAALLSGVGAATGAATGGLTAELIDFGADEHDVEYYERVLREGGALVVVDADTDAEEDVVEDVFESYSPIEIDDFEPKHS